MAELRARLMTLIHWLRNPHDKPPVTDAVDRRLDQVEQRLDEARRKRLQVEYDAMRRK